MSTHIGRRGEELVARVLKNAGHKIITLNWRTRRCEIDIVSRHKKTIYLTEVKTRSNARYGSGFEYITPAKLAQIRYAAALWTHENRWNGDVRLLGVAVDDLDSVEIIALDL